jgi:phosphoribosylaminoimidazolecarboxamide formyltransferase/IMP cyclohydrolase
MNDVEELRGGLIGSIMASDAFFTAADAVKLAKKEQVAAIIQPGGATKDFEVIEGANEGGIPMVFTGQRSFVG